MLRRTPPRGGIENDAPWPQFSGQAQPAAGRRWLSDLIAHIECLRLDASPGRAKGAEALETLGVEALPGFARGALVGHLGGTLRSHPGRSRRGRRCRSLVGRRGGGGCSGAQRSSARQCSLLLLGAGRTVATNNRGSIAVSIRDHLRVVRFTLVIDPSEDRCARGGCDSGDQRTQKNTCRRQVT